MEWLASIVAACLGVVLGWVTKTWRERRQQRERDELVIRRASDEARENADAAYKVKAQFYKTYADRSSRDTRDGGYVLGLRDKPADGEPVRTKPGSAKDQPESD